MIQSATITIFVLSATHILQVLKGIYAGLSGASFAMLSGGGASLSGAATMLTCTTRARGMSGDIFSGLIVCCARRFSICL
jgi:hypothetical protein